MKDYILKRLNEHSFWVGVGLAVTASMTLPTPWNWISLVAGIAGSLVPDGKVTK